MQHQDTLLILDEFRQAAMVGNVLRLRLCRAMRMLRETDKTVTEIAFACGFNDSNYFTSRFHREIGMTPLRYRRSSDAPLPTEPPR